MDIFRIDLFLLFNIKYYFVWNIYVYQGNKTGNIYIHHREKQPPIMIKAVINSSLASNIENDHYGAQKIFLDNMYACTEFFSIIFE